MKVMHDADGAPLNIFLFGLFRQCLPTPSLQMQLQS